MKRGERVLLEAIATKLEKSKSILVFNALIYNNYIKCLRVNSEIMWAHMKSFTGIPEYPLLHQYGLHELDFFNTPGQYGLLRLIILVS